MVPIGAGLRHFSSALCKTSASESSWRQQQRPRIEATANPGRITPLTTRLLTGYKQHAADGQLCCRERAYRLPTPQVCGSLQRKAGGTRKTLSVTLGHSRPASKFAILNAALAPTSRPQGSLGSVKIPVEATCSAKVTDFWSQRGVCWPIQSTHAARGDVFYPLVERFLAVSSVRVRSRAASASSGAYWSRPLCSAVDNTRECSFFFGDYTPCALRHDG